MRGDVGGVFSRWPDLQGGLGGGRVSCGSEGNVGMVGKVDWALQMASGLHTLDDMKKLMM
jgi:hypothetical protein